MCLVSIIIPCYNHGLYILEAIDSVIHQTYTNWEIIIINDGSTDSYTNKVIENISMDKVKIINTQNQGLSAARNIGIVNANADYIVLLDADNKLANTFIDQAMSIFGSTKVDIIYTDGFYFDGQVGDLIQEKVSMPKMLTRNLVDACSIFKKSVWQYLGGFNENMRYGWEDWDFWLSAIENGYYFFHVEKQLFYYRVLKNSMLHSIASEKNKRHILEQQLLRNHIMLYKKYFPEPLTLLRHYLWLEEEKQTFEKVKSQIYSSYSYRLGNFLLSPFKFFNRSTK